MRITITGPRSIGKTTVSKIVSEKLRLKRISSDELGEEAMKEKGGLDKAIKSGEIKQWIKNSAYGLIRKEYEKDDFVFDLSGGAFGSRKFAEASEKIREKVKNNSVIFGLLPYENENKSIKMLFEREKKRDHFKDMDKDELYAKVKKSYSKFPSLFQKDCNFIIYTQNKTPEKIANEIISSLKNHKKLFKSR